MFAKRMPRLAHYDIENTKKWSQICLILYNNVVSVIVSLFVEAAMVLVV